MPVFNQSRSRVIRILFGAVFIIILLQLVNLQVFSKKYKLAAENNAIFRKVIYPDRGIIFDRKRRALLENTLSYDLVVTPSEARGVDTAELCDILQIDTAEYIKRIRDLAYKNTPVRPSVFEPLLSEELYAKLYENMYKFPGFVLSERKARTYPFNAGASLLGYTAEVDSPFLRRHKDEGYEQGDFAGMTGLERSYEKVLMGQRGIQRLIKDNRNRIQGAYASGAYDTSAIAGKNIYTSIDIDLQKLGEKLMSNKVGSIVAIDPRTGGILCMVSAPTYNPNYLTGADRRKHFVDLLLDPRLPFNNRAIGNMYAPGSTFKTVSGIIGLTEGVIDENFTVTCTGAFYGCGTGKPKCLDKGTFNFKEAVAHSDNTYFATVYKRILDQPRYRGADSGLRMFNKYAGTFGLGNKLEVDLPFEKRGFLPTPEYYNKKAKGWRWGSCYIISNGIGQGEVLATPLQLANVMAIIANKGWYYAPHVVDSIEGGDEYDMLAPFKEKHYVDSRISDTVFNAEQDGMQAVLDYGTAAASHIPGIVACGKTGTAENYYKGVKQTDNSFFGAFAPRYNPKIAIAVLCESGGQGAWVAAPIASLMIEKYLKDSIPESDRLAKIEEIANKKITPHYMQDAINKRDSVKQAKELLKRPQEDVDSTSDDNNPNDSEIKPAPNRKPNNRPAPKLKISSAAILSKEDEKLYKYIARKSN
jgi:Cell division protein FtsI/penicillin-binding protein 2